MNGRAKLETHCSASVGREDTRADWSLQLWVDEPKLIALVGWKKSEIFQGEQDSLVLRAIESGADSTGLWIGRS